MFVETKSNAHRRMYKKIAKAKISLNNNLITMVFFTSAAANVTAKIMSSLITASEIVAFFFMYRNWHFDWVGYWFFYRNWHLLVNGVRYWPIHWNFDWVGYGLFNSNWYLLFDGIRMWYWYFDRIRYWFFYWVGYWTINMYFYWIGNWFFYWVWDFLFDRYRIRFWNVYWIRSVNRNLHGVRNKLFDWVRLWNMNWYFNWVWDLFFYWIRSWYVYCDGNWDFFSTG